MTWGVIVLLNIMNSDGLINLFLLSAIDLQEFGFTQPESERGGGTGLMGCLYFGVRPHIIDLELLRIFGKFVL